MSELTLLFQTPQTTVGDIELDAALTEVHRSAMEITQHPVEAGAEISDHARKMPDELRIEGVITNTPMILGAMLRGSATRAEEAYEALRGLEGQLVDVATSLREYQDMMITSLEVPRDAQWANAVKCSITLRHVRVVKSETASAGAAKAPAAAAPPRDLGKQPTLPAPAAANKSGFATAADWFRGLF